MPPASLLPGIFPPFSPADSGPLPPRRSPYGGSLRQRPRRDKAHRKSPDKPFNKSDKPPTRPPATAAQTHQAKRVSPSSLSARCLAFQSQPAGITTPGRWK